MSVSPPRLPTHRRVVALGAVVALLAVLGLIALTDAVSVDHAADDPAAVDINPMAIDAGTDVRRGTQDCPVPPGREGQSRQTVAAETALVEQVAASELRRCPQSWDGHRIGYRGEVVGALLDRGDHVWAQINDDPYGDSLGPLPTHGQHLGHNSGIGARLPPALAQDIASLGGPGRRGDVVEITGIFHRIDRASGEVAIIAVEELLVATRGGPASGPDAPARPAAAMIATLAAICAVIAWRRTVRTR